MGKSRRILVLFKDAWVILGITLMLFVSLEGMLRAAFFVRDNIRGRSMSAFSRYAVWQNGIADCAWKDEFLDEWGRSHHTRWTSYVYWRREPHNGRCINIDQNGIRKTWTSDHSRQGPTAPLTIFMFGGSTMWGTGARDDFTIPSLLARELDERAVACEVTNFGEAGYVTTQEVIMLIRQLQKGNVPDMVIFYDGVNDTYSAYQQQTAGLPENEFNRVREFNLSQPGSYKSLRRMFLHRAACELSTARLLEGLGLMGRSSGSSIHQSRAGDRVADREPLFREILAVYQSNMAIVQALAQRYGFKALFYWQPAIFDKCHRTAHEESQWRAHAALKPFFERTCELIRQMGLSAGSGGVFHDLTGTFAEVQEPIFLDWCHVSESGNRMIARRMAPDVLAAIESASALAVGQAAKGP